jgi:hypothetical protein
MTLRRYVFSLLCSVIILSSGGTICLAQELILVPPIDGPPPLPGMDPGALLQPISIFNNATPGNAVSADASAITLGLKFWSGTSGTVSAISFYRGATSPQGYIATLYSAAGDQLASVYMPQETGPVPGWQIAQFASPIPISPNTTYVAAYYAPSGQYADDYDGLKQGIATGPLTAPASATVGGNGVFGNGQIYPRSTANNDNYFVDVIFRPTVARPYLSLSFSPATPVIASNAAGGTVVTTITARWSDGTQFNGSLSFGAPYSNAQGVFAISGNDVIVNPTGPGLLGLANKIQNITITATF